VGLTTALIRASDTAESGPKISSGETERASSSGPASSQAAKALELDPPPPVFMLSSVVISIGVSFTPRPPVPWDDDPAVWPADEDDATCCL
jgi:hypothetical protein